MSFLWSLIMPDSSCLGFSVCTHACVLLGLQPRALCVPGECSATESHPSAFPAAAQSPVLSFGLLCGSTLVAVRVALTSGRVCEGVPRKDEFRVKAAATLYNPPDLWLLIVASSLLQLLASQPFQNAGSRHWTPKSFLCMLLQGISLYNKHRVGYAPCQHPQEPASTVTG